MSKISSLKRNVRLMNWDDIPEILWLAQYSPSSPWIGPDFLTGFQSRETLGYVVERNARILGFALCTVTRVPNIAHENLFRRLIDFPRWLMNARPSGPWHFDLLGIGVAAEAPSFEIERTLLKKLDEQLRHPDDHIRITVRETSLPAQQLLREAGYRAICVLRRHYGNEDAYLMERNRVEVCAVVQAHKPRLSSPGEERAVGETVRIRA